MSRDRNMNVIKASSLNHLNANSPLTNIHNQKHSSKNSNNLMNQISQLSRTNNNNEEDLAIKVNKKLKIGMLFKTKLNAFFTSLL